MSKLQEQQLQKIDGFRFWGTQDEIKELHELMKMVVSTPCGQKLLLDLKRGRKMPEIAFESEEIAEAMNRAGCFCEGKIRLVRIAILPEMKPRVKTKVKIQMASTLAHELQHCINLPRDNQLFKNAGNRDELIAAQVMEETSALITENQVGFELRAQNNLLENLYVYHHPGAAKNVFRVVESPKDPMYIQYGGKEIREERIAPAETLKTALSGELGYINYYIRKACRRIKHFNRNASSVAFRQNIEAYLSYLQIPMSFDDVMAQVRSNRFSRDGRFVRSFARVFGGLRQGR